MKKMKKLLAICLVLGLLLTACSGPKNQSDANSTSTAATEEKTDSTSETQKEVKVEEIEFLTQPWASAQNVPELQELFDKFTKDTGIKLNITVGAPDAAYRTKLIQQINSGVVPDVAFVDGNWLAEFHEMDALVPLDKWFTKEKQSKYFDYAIEGSMFDNKPHALYFHSGCWQTYYREDMLKAVGYDQAPKDWNELVDVSLKLKEKFAGQQGFYPLGIPGKKAEGLSCTFLPFFWGQGDYELSRDNKIVFGEGKDKEALINVLKYIQEELMGKKIMNPNAESIDAANVEKDFTAGSHAMAILGNWHYATMKKNGGEEFIKNVKIAQIPAYPGKQPMTTAGGWTIAMMCKDESKQDAAWKFIEYFGGPEVQYVLTYKAAQMTSLKEVYDMDGIKDDYVLQAFKNGLNNGKTRDKVTFYSIMSEQLQDMVQKAISGKIQDYDLVVTEAAKKAKDAIGE